MSHGGITVASSATKYRKKTGRFVHFASHATDASHYISSILSWTNRRADMYPLRDRHLMRGGTFLTTISISANVASPSQLSVKCLILFLYPLATPHPHDLGLPRRPRHLLWLDQPRSPVILVASCECEERWKAASSWMPAPLPPISAPVAQPSIRSRPMSDFLLSPAPPKNDMGWHSHQVQTEREEATVFQTGCLLGRLGLELIEQLRLFMDIH